MLSLNVMVNTVSRVSHRTCSYEAVAMPQSSAGMPMLVNSLQTPSLAPCWHRAAEPQIDIQPHRHKLHRWLRACHPCTPAGYLPTRTQPQQSTPWSLPGMQRDDSKSSSQKQHSFLLFIKLLEMLNCPFFFFSF